MIYVILDNIRSALNVGAIFRTADALGVGKLFLCGTTPVPGQPGKAGKELVKTALGAEGYVPWEKVKRTGDVIRRLKQEGCRIIALEQDNRAIDIRDYRFHPSQKYALIVGYEVHGIDKRILSRCDKIIYIPMFGRKESLNVSVAFGVAGYCLKFKTL